MPVQRDSSSDSEEEVVHKKTTKNGDKMLNRKTKPTPSSGGKPAKRQARSDSDSDDVPAKKNQKNSDSDSEDEADKSDASEEVVHTNGNKAKPQASASAGHNELFVRNLSYNTTEESLQAYFETYGTVTKVKILTNRDDGRSKGIGFVEFSSNEEAKAALDDAANLNCDGRY